MSLKKSISKEEKLVYKIHEEKPQHATSYASTN